MLNYAVSRVSFMKTANSSRKSVCENGSWNPYHECLVWLSHGLLANLWLKTREGGENERVGFYFDIVTPCVWWHRRRAWA